MNYLHYDLNLQPGDVVEVMLDKQANVRLLDHSNYLQYQRGVQHRYYGGLATKSPCDLVHLILAIGTWWSTWVVMREL